MAVVVRRCNKTMEQSASNPADKSTDSKSQPVL